MILEIVTLLSWLIGGSATARLLGIRGWGLPFFGFVIGICIYIGISFVQLVIPGQSSPLIAIAISFIAPTAVWLYFYYKKWDVSVSLPHGATIIGIFLATVVFFRKANLVNWSVDSFDYLGLSSLITSGLYDLAPLNRVIVLPLAGPFIHAPSVLTGNLYLHSVMPILSASTVVILAWIFIEGTRGIVQSKTIPLYLIAGILLLITNNRFVFHSLYINNHMLFATLILIVSGCSWLLKRDSSNISNRSLILIQSIAVSTMTFTRPEGPLVSALALMPMILNKGLSWRLRSVPLIALGASVLAKEGFFAIKFIGESEALPSSVYGLFILGSLILLFIPIFKSLQKWLSKNQKNILFSLEAGLWVALALLYVIKPEVLIRSLNSTFQNTVLGAGSWGLSLIVLALLFLVLAVYKKGSFVELRFPVTTFLPLMLILAYLRGGSYRVGDGDSLNRALVHMLPLAILLLLTMAASLHGSRKSKSVRTARA